MSQHLATMPTTVPHLDEELSVQQVCEMLGINRNAFDVRRVRGRDLPPMTPGSNNRLVTTRAAWIAWWNQRVGEMLAQAKANGVDTRPLTPAAVEQLRALALEALAVAENARAAAAAGQ